MLPSYKLTYFDIRGLGEPSRLLFLLAGVPFEDQRIPFEAQFAHDGSWQKRKKTFPFGQLPVLSVDGFEIPQSAAIHRYLAKKFGYSGKTPEEEAWVDAIVDQIKDFFVPLRKLVIAQRDGKSDAEDIEKITLEVVNPAKATYFKILNNILEKSKSGFLVGDGVTFADLVVADNIETLQKMDLLEPSEQPKLVALKEKVYDLPAIKNWIATRKDSEI